MSSLDPRFETAIDRRGQNSVKLDFVEFKFGVPAEEAIALWVADEDWQTPDFVLDAIRNRLAHPCLGYTHRGFTYRSCVRNWLESRFAWRVASDAAIVTALGCVPALATCVRAFTEPSAGVVLFTPVYYPMHMVVINNGRRLLLQQLVRSDDGVYSVDFAALERLLREEKPQMLLWCSPHNPIGRVWTEAELTRLGELCAAHGVVVVSDEIWANLAMPAVDDFARPGAPRRVTPLAAAAGGRFRDIVVTCTSASKAFNMASVQEASVVIENDVLRQLYQQQITAQGQFGGNFAGAVATEAALSEQGREWLDSSIAHIAANMQFVRRALLYGVERVDTCAPADTPTFPYGVRPNRPEATYLMWLDCRDLDARLRRAGYRGLGAPAAAPAAPETPAATTPFNQIVLQRTPSRPTYERDGGRSLLLDFFSERAGVVLDDGLWFGDECHGFLRINVATQRHVLERAMRQIAAAVSSL